jgi:hypothetical protein
MLSNKWNWFRAYYNEQKHCTHIRQEQKDIILNKNVFRLPYIYGDKDNAEFFKATFFIIPGHFYVTLYNNKKELIESGFCCDHCDYLLNFF